MTGTGDVRGTPARPDRAEARRLLGEGIAATTAGRPEDGAALLRSALSTARRAVPEPGGDEPPGALAGRILVSLAHAEAEQGRVERGERLLAEAAGLLPDSELGVLYGQRGLLLLRLSRHQEALPVLDAAVARLSRGGAPVDLTSALLNRGYLHIEAGHGARARADLQRCRRIATDHDLPELVAKAEHNLAILAFTRGDLPAALRRFDVAAGLYRRHLPSFAPVLAIDRARALLAAGLAEEADHELRTAVRLAEAQHLSLDAADALLWRAQAALLAERPAESAHWAGLAAGRYLARRTAARAAVAELTRLRAQLAAAAPPQPLHARAGRLAHRLQALGLGEDARVAELLAVRALVAAGRTEAGARRLRRMTRSPPGAALDTMLLAHLTRVELAAATGDRAALHRELRAGLTRLHQHRTSLGCLDLQAGVGVLGREMAQAAIAQAVLTGRPSEVFAWSERARAQAFRVRPVRPPDDPVAAEASGALRRLRYRIRAAELGGEPTTQLRTELPQLERVVRERAWMASGDRGALPTVTLRQATDRLGDRTMLVWLADGDRLVGLAARQGEAVLVGLGSVAAATERVRRLRADVDALAGRALPARIRQVVQDSCARSAADLAGQVLTPLLPVARDSALVVVPTGPLYGVPWQLLPPCRDRPVTVSPSATFWISAVGRAGGVGPEPGSRTGVEPLLVAGPGLEHAESEVARIGSLRPTAVRLVGAAASADATLDALDGRRLAHLAAHGQHNRDNALFSSLHLAGSQLMGYDLQRLRRPPRQAVLSACDLGQATVRPGDEMLGLVAALLATGTATVVASVGRVPDDEAADLMVGYHRALLGGAAPSPALAEATRGSRVASFVCFGAG